MHRSTNHRASRDRAGVLLLVQRTRGHGAELPAWWLQHVRELVADSGVTNVVLARQCSQAVARRPPWHHSVLSRFLRGQNCTTELAEALSIVLDFGLPIYVARSLEEAVAFQSVAHRFTPITDRQRERLAAYDAAAAKLIADQTGGVDSANGAGTERRRAARRDTRGGA